MELSSSHDLTKVKLKHLFVVGAHCHLVVTKTASMIWANFILKRHDAGLVKIKDNISFKSFMKGIAQFPFLGRQSFSPRTPLKR